jgi:hypothetical protein
MCSIFRRNARRTLRAYCEWWEHILIFALFIGKHALYSIITFFVDDIEWPDEEDWPVQPEAKSIITSLLQQSPRERLGTGGSHEVKEHPYFYGVNWNSLLRQKAEFVPQLTNDEDTSYFDSKSF